MNIQEIQEQIANGKKEFLNIYFKNEDLSKVYFYQINLSRAKFINCNLKNARFLRCNLENADFSYSDLALANLSESNLTNTNFENSNLNECELFGCYLENTKISKAKNVSGIHHLLIDENENNSIEVIKKLRDITQGYFILKREAICFRLNWHLRCPKGYRSAYA